MKTIEQAHVVIEKLNGATLNGATLEVKFADQDQGEKNQIGPQGTKNDNLYVRNLPSMLTEGDVTNLFGVHGQVKEVKILPSGDPERGNGALIRMGSNEEAQAAINALHNHTPAGYLQALQVRFADTAQDKARKSLTNQRKSSNNQQLPYNNQIPQQVAYVNGQPVPIVMDPITGQATLGNAGGVNNSNQLSSVYVCNLPPETDKLFLYEMFNEFGGVKNVRVLADEGGKCKGVGFVNYVDLPSAQRAIQARNGFVIGDREIFVSLQQKKK